MHKFFPLNCFDWRMSKTLIFPLTTTCGISSWRKSDRMMTIKKVRGNDFQRINYSLPFWLIQTKNRTELTFWKYTFSPIINWQLYPHTITVLFNNLIRRNHWRVTVPIVTVEMSSEELSQHCDLIFLVINLYKIISW